MINALIVEDEELAVKRLIKILSETDNTINIMGQLDTVQETVSWLLSNSKPDLIFLDIQLADGLSFEIFELTEVNTPIIFTTAYDQYALNAFKVNSIDYLLKPLTKDDLTVALNKFKQRIGTNTLEKSQVATLMRSFANQHKNRFLIKIGEHIKSIPTAEIGYFFSRDKATYCMTLMGKSYLLDYSLEQLAPMIDNEKYFKINRAYMVSYEVINDIISYSNSRLKLVLDHSTDHEIIVSRERVQAFKKWLDQ
jgi:DNA-binding LytR/AlgR family response regulator